MAVALALGVLSPIMTAKRNGSQSADMQQLAARLSAAREQFSADIARGLGGRAAHARFDRLDDLLRQVVSASDLGTPVPLAVCATGGYGRRTLCLHSDIDLLIVFDGAIGRAEERFVKDVLHPLWDLRLTVGHQVRTLADMREIEHDNPELLLALLDLRLIAGEPVRLRRGRRTIPPRQRRLPRSGHRRPGAADRRAVRTVQRHGLSARAGREGIAGRAPRYRGGPRVHLARQTMRRRHWWTRTGSTRRKASCSGCDRCCTSTPGET